MAVSNEQLSILVGMLTNLTNEQKIALGSASTQDLAQAAAELIASERSTGMGQAITSLITGTVSNWPALEAAAAAADGATLYSALDVFNAALQAHNASALMAGAVRVALAAKKHFNR
jgi:hypothetical protein